MANYARIGLVVAAAAGLFVCAAQTLHIRNKITGLRADVQKQTTARAQAQTALEDSQKKVGALSNDLAIRSKALAVAISDYDRAEADLNGYKTRLVQSGVERIALTRELTETQQQLARYTLAGLQPEQIIEAALYIKQLESSVNQLHAENQILLKRMEGLQLASGGGVPALPVGLRGKVLAYDPKWRFVVINVGEKDGVLKQGELVVSRFGKMVAKAKIVRVEADRCIANLMGGWEIGEVSEGDLAQPAPTAI